MDFYILNNKIDAQIKELIALIRLSMNGVVAQKMEDSGFRYKKNFGVSIPRLREMAAKYSLDHDLAVRFWMMRIRETMILSTLIDVPDLCDEDVLMKRIRDVDNIELAEQLVMNLLVKVKSPEAIVRNCLEGHCVWMQVVGFLLATRVNMKLTDQFKLYVLNRVSDLSMSSDFNLGRSMGLCLARFVRVNGDVRNNVVELVRGFGDSEFKARQLIAYEVESELLFF